MVRGSEIVKENCPNPDRNINRCGNDSATDRMWNI